MIIRKEAIWVAPPKKMDPFNFTWKAETSTLLI